MPSIDFRRRDHSTFVKSSSDQLLIFHGFALEILLCPHLSVKSIARDGREIESNERDLMTSRGRDGLNGH